MGVRGDAGLYMGMDIMLCLEKQAKNFPLCLNVQGTEQKFHGIIVSCLDTAELYIYYGTGLLSLVIV